MLYSHEQIRETLKKMSKGEWELSNNEDLSPTDTVLSISTQLLDREDEIKRKIEEMSGVGFNDVVSRKAVLALFN